MTTHLDLDALADLLAGEGSDTDVAHVGDCAGCAGRLDELAAADAEVAATLSALPAPEVPAGLAERLEAALAAEPALPPTDVVPAWARTDGTAGDAEDDGEDADDRSASRTVTPFPAARTRRWAPVAAAAALLVAAGTVGGVLVLSDRDDQGTDSLAAGEAAPERASALDDLATSSTGRDYASDGALATALPDLLEGDARPSAAVADALPPVAATRSGEALSSDDSAGGGGAAATQDGRADDPLARLRDPAELASCLSALLPPDDPSVRPIAVDYAAYGGQPALVVVLPAVGAPEKVDVFVVGAGCRPGDDRTLFFTRLDRPAEG